VQSQQAPYGVVPFENSTHGVVTFTLDNLADRAGAYADIVVCDEVYLDVHHFLLGRFPPPSPPVSSSSPAAAPPPVESAPSPTDNDNNDKKHTPLTSLSHIRRIYSHPQAFGQTGLFVSRYLPHAETVEVSSTSRAAELAAADAEGASAAIASEMAGRGVGLDVLARWVEDREDNTTRFFVVRRREGGVEGGVEGGEGGEVPQPERGRESGEEQKGDAAGE
jgi:prephenate dehydratase